MPRRCGRGASAGDPRNDAQRARFEASRHEVSQRGAVRSRRWRARPKADLDHAASADGAQIDAMAGEDCVALAIIGGFDGRGRLRRLESSADGWKLGGAAGIRQEAEVTDAAEPFRQHVEQEATNELVSVERHHLGLVVGAIILPAEADATVLAGEEPAVGDRDAMGVASQIVEHLLRPAEGALGIDDPFDIGAAARDAGRRPPVRIKPTRLPKNSSSPLSNAACRRSRNRRRYSRDRTRTGRKKLGRQPTQRPSAARPPPGTTQWACG